MRSHSARYLMPLACSLFAGLLACSSESDSSFGPGSSGQSSGGKAEGDLLGSSSGGTSGGSSSGSCAATLAQTQKAKVDLIFVIDDSGSMDLEMAQIKANVNTFASKIGSSGLDYTVIFIVKKANSPTQTGNVICVPTPLAGANCADNPPLFHHINQDVQSTNSFQLILSTYDSANPSLNWKQHLRADSYKVFVEVTDDQSSISATSFDQQLLAKAPAGMFGTATARKYIFHSIVGWQEGTPILSSGKCASAMNTGPQYQELSQLTGGIVDSVCKTDYSGVLDKLAKNVVDKLGCELTVPSAASSDPTTLVVQMTPAGGTPTALTQVTDVSKCAQFPDAWYYDNNTKPTKILLCTGACGKATGGTKLEALVGCKAPAPR